MTYEPIKTLEIENYGCIRRANFALTRLHALIGPNDSGKSTALRALRTAAQFGAGSFEDGDTKAPRPFDPMLDLAVTRTDSTRIALRYEDTRAYVVQIGPGRVDEFVLHGSVSVITQSKVPRGWNSLGLLWSAPAQATSPQTVELSSVLPGTVELLKERVAIATMVRFDPDSLRAPAPLLPEGRGICFADERGTGLSSVFDAIVNRDSDAFAQIQKNVRALFPTVSKLGLNNVSTSHKEMAVTLTDGTRHTAKAMSEGLLYYLGFVALRHIAGSGLFLVEEPENGLHPARIGEVVGVLREISKTSQVIVATHSPFVLNELEGDEISVVTRDPVSGTKVSLLKDVPGFADASKVYLPGEFWVSYADGKMEEPLLTGRPRT